MSEQIEPGPGWRLLRPDELVQAGDEVWNAYAKSWVQRDGYIGDNVCEFRAVRRRIPSKPEKLMLKEVTASICYRKKKTEQWQEVVAIDVTFPGHGHLDATEARQLADWLNQFADWREARSL